MAGASAHAVCDEVTTAATQRRNVAIQTQKMMLSILLARQACENDAFNEADRGSDMGDHMELDCMELDCLGHDVQENSELDSMKLCSDDESDHGDVILSDVR